MKTKDENKNKPPVEKKLLQDETDSQKQSPLQKHIDKADKENPVANKESISFEQEIETERHSDPERKLQNRKPVAEDHDDLSIKDYELTKEDYERTKEDYEMEQDLDDDYTNAL